MCLDIVNKYKIFNNKFPRSLVFKIGDEAGFFSEYNNMILAMLYCLENDLKFKITSRGANFSYLNGWKDYFQDFCEEENSDFHFKYNHRRSHLFTPLIRHRLKKLGLVKNVGINFPWWFRWLRKFNFCPLLTQDVFNEARSLDREKNYSYPCLGIDGDLQVACRKLVDITWNFNEKTQNEINQYIEKLRLPDEYIGMQIRRGDKNLEWDLLSTEKYFEIAERKSNLKNVFILTDDYSVIEEIRLKFGDYNIFTLCQKDEKGYSHKLFTRAGTESKRKMFLKLFSSMEILSKSQISIGTYSSNPGMFLGMKMGPARFYGVDFDRWFVW